jgi:hypothetical protein
MEVNEMANTNFYVIEGMKPAPTKVEVPPTAKKATYEMSLVVEIGEDDIKRVIEALFPKHITAMDMEDDVDAIYDALFIGEEELSVGCVNYADGYIMIDASSFMLALEAVTEYGSFVISKGVAKPVMSYLVCDDIVKVLMEYSDMAEDSSGVCDVLDEDIKLVE